MGVLFEIINNPTANDAVNVTESFRGLAMAVSYRMQMIRHDDISIDGKSARFSSFIQSFAGDNLDCIRAKYWQAVFGYSG